MSLKAVLFNKPYGVVTQFTPVDGNRCLADFGLPRGVYAAGRLDADSEGLLLLVNDGRLQHRLTDPRFGHPRTYWVQVERVPAAKDLERLADSVKLSDGPTKPCEVRLLEEEPEVPARNPPIRFRKNVPTAWLEMTLTEGRNRQVRRMTAAVGHPTLRLVRASIGPVSVKGLGLGQWRWATGEEVSGLRTVTAVAKHHSRVRKMRQERDRKKSKWQAVRRG